MIVAGIGRITKDIELRYIGDNNTAAVNFTVAVNDRFKKDHTNFFVCKAFGKTAENISKYILKGQRIYIEGELRQESWEKNDTKYSIVTINVNNFNFIEKKDSTPQQQDNANYFDGDDSDQDTPF